MVYGLNCFRGTYDTKFQMMAVHRKRIHDSMERRAKRNMEIRTMKIDDYENLYRLWMACKGMGLNDLDDSREGITRFLKRNPDTCFVAAEK